MMILQEKSRVERLMLGEKVARGTVQDSYKGGMICLHLDLTCLNRPLSLPSPQKPALFQYIFITTLKRDHFAAPIAMKNVVPGLASDT